MTLVFRNRLDPDNGRQIFQPTPPVQLLDTVAAIKAALLVPGTYDIAPGTYVADFIPATANVTMRCKPGVIFQGASTTSAAWTILADNFGLTGTWRLNAGIHTAMTIGNEAYTTQAQQPDNVLIQGGNIVGNIMPIETQKGIACHGSNVTISNCKIEGIASNGTESQAFWCCNTNGPITIIDSFLEATGEVLLSGGSDILIPGAIPSDVYIARNTFYKRPSWRPPTQVLVKNNFEVKNGNRWTLEDNVFDGSWNDAQIGCGIVFTVRNSGHSTHPSTPSKWTDWVSCEDIVIHHNIVRNVYDPASFAVTILGHDDGGRASEQTQRVTITNNLFEDSDNFLQINSGVTEMLLIDHNTFNGNTNAQLIQFANVFTLSTIRMTNNAGNEGHYGVFVSGGANSPIASLDQGCGPGNYVVTGNIFGRNQTNNPVWPPGNTVVGPASTKLPLTPPPECFLTGAQAGADAGWNGPAGVGRDGDGTTQGGAP